MKRELANFIALLGLVLLGAAVVLGLLTGILFIFPNTSIFGARAVNERDTQVIYHDADLVNAFANGKFILESTGTQVEVKMSSSGYEGQNTIVVNEAATGVAFNDLNRTLIEWTQTLYNDELYYRIKVMEPSGMVFKQKPTTVYINLPYRNDDFRYNFVLQNHYSNVNFSFVDRQVSNTNKFLINDLVVESAASVNFPYFEKSSINNVSIKGSHTKVICKSKVLNNVFVNGSNHVLDFGNDSKSGIEGNLTIHGNNHRFKGTTAHDVQFDAQYGTLTMNQTIASLKVKTVSAAVNVVNVSGKVEMQTQSGKLKADSIGNGLEFTAGDASAPYATAALEVGRVTGTSVVKNYGTGQIRLKNVNGDVTVRSSEIGGKSINVDFLAGSGSHTVDITGYDGDINVHGINGGNVKIDVKGRGLQAAKANINATFNQVGNAEIYAGGYLSGHENWGGTVTARIANGCNPLNLYVYYAGAAHRNGSNISVSDDENNSSAALTHISGSGSGTGTLKICARRVEIK